MFTNRHTNKQIDIGTEHSELTILFIIKVICGVSFVDSMNQLEVRAFLKNIYTDQHTHKITQYSDITIPSARGGHRF